jgi:DNA-binding GntR family transcriptional regulator
VANSKETQRVAKANSSAPPHRRTRSGGVVPITRRTVVDLAVEELRERILHGDYPDGYPLRQDALAESLGVSRIPVREALRQLEADGLVVVNPHQGAVVSMLSLDEVEELFELRALIESDLMRRATPHMDEARLQRAGEVLDEYEAAFERREIAAWGQLNWEFHSTLLSAAGRAKTLGVLQTLHNQSERYLRMQLALTHGEMKAIGEHRGILAAARSGDPEATAQRTAEHIMSAGRALTDFLKVHREDAGAAG